MHAGSPALPNHRGIRLWPGRISPIGKRLVLSMLLASSTLALLISAYEILGEYRSGREELKAQQTALLQSLGGPLTQSLWRINDEQTASLLDAMADWDTVDWISLQPDIGQPLTRGEHPGEQSVASTLELLHPGLNGGRPQPVGVIRIASSLDPLLASLAYQATRLLVFNTIKALIVACIALMLFNRLITRHLAATAAYLDEGSLDTRTDRLALDRDSLGQGDELDRITTAINRARDQLATSRRSLDAQQARLAAELQAQHKELKLAHERLLARDRLATIGSLTGMVAHELRNPLGAIGAGNVLARARLKRGDDRLRLPELERNEAAVERCNRIIEEMRQIGASREPDWVVDDFGDWLRGRVADSDTPAGIAVEVDLAPAVRVKIEPFGLTQLLRNLLLNASQSIAERFPDPALGEGHISISLRADGDQALVTLSDNGVGLSASSQTLAFEPLYTTKVNGFGMGLVVAQRQASLHHGALELNNRSDGPGVRAELRLPLFSDSVATTPASPPPAD